MITEYTTKKISDNTIIWKYMDLNKFIFLLMNKQLYFSSSKSLSDEYEGLVPEKNHLKWMNHLQEKYHHTPEMAEKEIEKIKDNIERNKRITFVNCWTTNEHESFALWKIYLSGNKNGVAIKTTKEKLKQAIKNIKINDDIEIYLSKIKYDDFITFDSYNRFNINTFKNSFYQFEKELRLFSFDDQKKNFTSLNIDVVINILIEKIYISPFADNLFKEVFRETLHRFEPGLKKRIRESMVKDK